MNVLFIVLNKTEYLDEILDQFVDIGVRGATIIDSQGMGSALVDTRNVNEPFFGVLRNLLDVGLCSEFTIYVTIMTVNSINEVTTKGINVSK